MGLSTWGNFESWEYDPREDAPGEQTPRPGALRLSADVFEDPKAQASTRSDLDATTPSGVDISATFTDSWRGEDPRQTLNRDTDVTIKRLLRVIDEAGEAARAE